VLIAKMQSVFAYHVTFCRKLENKILQIMHFKPCGHKQFNACYM